MFLKPQNRSLEAFSLIELQDYEKIILGMSDKAMLNKDYLRKERLRLLTEFNRRMIAEIDSN